jgi:hypothetical protein
MQFIYFLLPIALINVFLKKYNIKERGFKRYKQPKSLNGKLLVEKKSSFEKIYNRWMNTN